MRSRPEAIHDTRGACPLHDEADPCFPARMKKLTFAAFVFLLGGLSAPLLLACADDKANGPPAATGTSAAMDSDAGAAPSSAPATHGGGW